MVKNLPASVGDARDAGSISGLESSPGRGHSTPLQYSCLENSMDREAWWTTVHGVTKKRTQPSMHASTSKHTSLSSVMKDMFVAIKKWSVKAGSAGHIYRSQEKIRSEIKTSSYERTRIRTFSDSVCWNFNMNFIWMEGKKMTEKL